VVASDRLIWGLGAAFPSPATKKPPVQGTDGSVSSGTF
jgi:hypothetical protein